MLANDLSSPAKVRAIIYPDNYLGKEGNPKTAMLAFNGVIRNRSQEYAGLPHGGPKPRDSVGNSVAVYNTGSVIQYRYSLIQYSGCIPYRL